MASNDIHTVIRYDGPALAEHEIDVQELAPALLALADLIQLANRKFNGDATAMRVTVKADVEQRCFQLQIHIFQTLLQHAQQIFGTAEYKTAKEIAEFLDLIVPGGFLGGVFALWKMIAKRQREGLSQTSLVTEQHGGQTIINNFYGDGSSVAVRTEVYDLATDPQATELGRKVLKPLEQAGYDTVAFYEEGAAEPVVQIDKDEATTLIELPTLIEPPELDLSDDEHNKIHARVLVKTQRNEGRAQWELKWGARAEWASIDDTDWLARFQSGQVPHTIPFYLDVEMDMVTSKSNPDAPARFHVLQVLGVIQSSSGRQTGLFDGGGGDEDA